MTASHKRTTRTPMRRTPRTAASAPAPVPSPGKSGGRPRAPLAVRMTLVAFSLVLLVTAALAGLNLRAATLGSQATAALSSNLSAASRSDADLSSLLVRQEQTDARFDDALTAAGMVLPTVKDSIESNAATSRRLTSLIRDALDGSSDSSGSSSSTSSPSASASSSSSPSSSSPTTTSGLTEKQRQEIERMLSSSSASPSATSTSTSPSSTSTSTTRPW